MSARSWPSWLRPALVVVGRLLARTRRQLAAQLVRVRQAAQRERELLTAAARTQERAALAREMHDVVSHQVSLIAIDPAPASRLADLSSLVEHSGMSASLDVADAIATRTWPETLERAADRTVQEALTNARKYAPDATAGMGSSACASASSCSVAACPPARRPRVASSSAPACQPAWDIRPAGAPLRR
ncbi:histidine kinase [Fodinicola acaciae]|uniref:histidine kinase n=1 Tax=Fodinicola acaciae TaxID=2681555 RepID=UPI001FE82E1D|nr:histidine kinase [Fodinicola acaciae]